MSQRPPTATEPHDPSENYVRMLAGLEVKIEKLVREVETVKGEVRLIAPRLDTLAEVKENSRLVHHQAGVITKVTNEALGLSATRAALEKLVEDLQTETKARSLELERAIGALERDHAFTEDRLRRLRDSVVEELAARKPNGV